MPDEDQKEEDEQEEMKERAASIREQIKQLRAGRPGAPSSPREFVDQQTGQKDDKREEASEDHDGESEKEPEEDT
jgi:hypothetical protein